MTANEIIKALECCVQYKTTDVRTYKGMPLEVFSEATLDLINRQRAEIERLKDLNNQLETDIINANMNLEHITYEFDLLKQEKSVVIAEAIKEFAERLKEKKQWDVDIPDYVYVKDIDNLIKEMVGEG